MARAAKTAKAGSKKATATAKKVSAKATDIQHKMHDASEKASELAKKIWLAGLGAYGKAYDEAREQVDHLGDNSTKFFDELVSKGRKLEGSTQKTVKQVKSKASKATHSLEDRIAKVRESLHFDLSGMNPYAKLDEIAHKVDVLSRKVDSLSKPAAKAAPKAASKAAPKAASKPRTVKKAAAAKPAAAQ